MKYPCLVYGEEKEIGAMTDDECMAYDQALRNTGKCIASEALQPYRCHRARPQRKGVHQGRPVHGDEGVFGWVLSD
jgi:hypothetical protein